MLTKDELDAVNRPDFVRESNLPRGYFDRKWYERIPQLRDGWVAVIVVALLVFGLLVIGYAK